MLAAGTAAAAADPDAQLEFRPTIRVDLVDGKTDFSTAKFDSYYIRLHKLPADETGEIELTLKSPTKIKYYNISDSFNTITDPEEYSGTKSFPIHPDTEYSYSDGRHDIVKSAQVAQVKDGRFINEGAFDGTGGTSEPFTVTMDDVGGTTFANYIPSFLKMSVLLSDPSDAEAIAPYVTLRTSGGKLTGATVKFVKQGDPNQEVDVSDSAYLGYGTEVAYFGCDDAGFIGEEVSDPSWNLKDGNFDFTSAPDLKNVWCVTVRVSTSSFTNTVYTEYEWNNILNWPKAAEIVVPDAAAVADANTAANSLDSSVTVVAMTGSGVTQNTALIVDGDGNQKTSPIPSFANISSAIAVNEPVAQGQGLLVGGINLPFNETSLTTGDLPPFSEGNYTVLKYFSDGSYVDLKGLGVIDFDTSASEAKLNASLVIVDGKPGSESGVTYPATGNTNYGVKVVESGSNRYLFVYDGNEDGNANDPIALSSVQSTGGSGGGCDAGFGIFGVFALAGVGLFMRRGR
jgi:hypothetical protein